ncbi:helix-turn-helix domain-containing protein [Escherichia coli]|uniref:helix-turn-helix domain-containing protein n=1 Tax=Escherichia coli TaxID=562 RepID=UPI003855EEFC
MKVSQDSCGQPDLRFLLYETRQAVIEATLIFTNGNQSKAATLLGLNRMTIARVIKKTNKLTL